MKTRMITLRKKGKSLYKANYKIICNSRLRRSKICLRKPKKQDKSRINNEWNDLYKYLFPLI
jgi:hypothetical protein